MFFGSRDSIKRHVRRTLTLVSLICLATLAVFYPAIEALDRWDAPGPFSDSEIQIIAVLTLVGAMFVLARLLVTFVLSFLERVLCYLSRSARNSGETAILGFVPMHYEDASPPLIVALLI